METTFIEVREDGTLVESAAPERCDHTGERTTFRSFTIGGPAAGEIITCCVDCGTQLSFVVKTDEGYIGKLDLSSPLSSQLPRSFAYVYDTEVVATQVAAMFEAINGKVEVL